VDNNIVPSRYDCQGEAQSGGVLLVLSKGKERVKGTAAHPTQKPLRMLSHLVKVASLPGQLILDPFMGVGSTGEAALQADRKFLGVEIDPRYYRAAGDRLRQWGDLETSAIEARPEFCGWAHPAIHGWPAFLVAVLVKRKNGADAPSANEKGQYRDWRGAVLLSRPPEAVKTFLGKTGCCPGCTRHPVRGPVR
jgi:hypothetical protein